MKDFCEKFTTNKIKITMLKEILLCCLLNKKELENLYFYLIKKSSYAIKFIESPTEEMKLLAKKKKTVKLC